MEFYVLTLFPDMIIQGMQTSILGRAVESGKIALRAVDIRDYTENKHKKVDDYPYGGGAGMLMQAQPVYDCYRHIVAGTKKPEKRKRVIYVTPQGRPFEQKMAQELAGEEELFFLCGHYEGIDERVQEEIVTDYVSIGDYVLTGGELPAMVMMDAIARLVPGVLHNESSAEGESFCNDLLEYPQYTRPERWHGKSVPPVLLTGAHEKITNWRTEQSIIRTRERRPDLFQKYERRQVLSQMLRKKNKLLYTDMTELLNRGDCHILYESKEGLLLFDEKGGIYLLALFEQKNEIALVDAIPTLKEEHLLIVHQEELLPSLSNRFEIKRQIPCIQAVYTQNTLKAVPKTLAYRPLSLEHLEEVLAHYHMAPDEDYIAERLKQGAFYGGYLDGLLVGFAGIHQEGSMGMLQILEPYRKRGYGEALEAFMINHQLLAGKIPYCHIVADNIPSLKLQEKLGLYSAKGKIYWLTVAEKKLALQGEM